MSSISKSARRFVAAIILAAACSPVALASPLDPAQVRVISLPSSEAPTVDLRVVIASGSADDPPGREGAAWFTAHLMARGTTPGGPLSVSVGKDSIAFSGEVPRAAFDGWYAAVRDALLKPSLDPADAQGVRAEQVRALETLGSSDDALASEALDALMYRNHPYGHPIAGWLHSASTLTREDSAAFHAAHLVKGNVVVGIAGSVSEAQIDRLRSDFATLPDGQPTRPARSSTALPSHRILLLQKPGADRVTLRIGEPLTLTRFHTDFLPLSIATAAFGAPGMAWARLGADLRFQRGLSEAAEASIEGSGDAGNPPAWESRRRERALSIRLAPKPINAKFALKLALADLEDLAANGVAAADLAEPRAAVVRAHEQETAGADHALAAAIDEAVEGASGFDERFTATAEAVTAPQTQSAAQRQLTARRVAIVAVVPDAAAFLEGLLSSETMIEYPAGIARETYRARDLDIVGMPGRMTRDAIEIVRSEAFFN
ncbi:MAG: insulinase family protein [Acidobacteria bacterium]|nr:insulinase family protein [Acidobacteriota bacterium]